MKKFIEYMNKQGIRNLLAVGVIAFVLTFLLLITFLKIPEKNHDMVNLSFGWISGAGTMVLGYYFGSIKKEKEELVP